MPKQRRSNKSARARRQTSRGAISERSSTRISQDVMTDVSIESRSTISEANPDSSTRPLTAGDIPTIIQQVTAAISAGSSLPSDPTPTRIISHTPSSEEISTPSTRHLPTSTDATTASHTTASEEGSSNQLSGVLKSTDIPSLVDAVVSRLSTHHAGSSSSQPGNCMLIY